MYKTGELNWLDILSSMETLADIDTLQSLLRAIAEEDRRAENEAQRLARESRRLERRVEEEREEAVVAQQEVQNQKIELDQKLAERQAILQDVTKRIKKILASGGLGAALAMAKNGQFNQLTWAKALLVAMRLPVTADNVAAIAAWEMAEGGHSYNTAYYNPLNTTQSMPGASIFNSVGVKAYTSWKQGLEATVITMKNGYYDGIIAALQRGNDSSAVAAAVGASPWGTGNFVRHTKGQFVTEVAAISSAQEAPRRGLAIHPWRSFFLVALLPTAVVAFPGSLMATSEVNTNGFALLAALLVARACDRTAPLPAATARRVVLFAASLAVILAVVWLGSDGVGALVLYSFTAVVTAVALSGAYSRTPALRELVRPLLRVRARWSAWLVAVLAWPLFGVAGVAISRLGAPTQAIGFSSDILGPWLVLGAIVTAIPATLAWYGFAARRLLASRSALLTAVLVGLVPWLAIVLPASTWSDPLSQLVLGFSHPFDSYVVRSCLGALASGVVGVWILQRSRVSLLPVLVFLSETTVVSWAVFVGQARASASATASAG